MVSVSNPRSLRPTRQLCIRLAKTQFEQISASLLESFTLIRGGLTVLVSSISVTDVELEADRTSCSASNDTGQLKVRKQGCMCLECTQTFRWAVLLDLESALCYFQTVETAMLSCSLTDGSRVRQNWRKLDLFETITSIVQQHRNGRVLIVCAFELLQTYSCLLKQ